LASVRVSPAALAKLAVIGAAVLWGTVGVAGRFAPEGVSAAALGEARLLLGGGTLVAVLGPARVLRSLATAPRGPLFRAVLGMAFFQWAFFAAVDDAGAGMAAVLSAAAAPLAADALTARRDGARLAPGWWLAATMLVSAAALASPPRWGTRLAVVEALAAGAGYALYADAAASLARARRREPAGLTTTAIALAGGGVALLPAAFRHLPELASARGLLVAAYLGLAATALAYALFTAGLARLGAADGLALVLAQPLAALALDRFLLGRTLSTPVIAGAALAGASPLMRRLRPR
jgi:DME family drug/metabolite transporter